MSFTLGISKLLGLRHQHGDQAVLDLLQVAMLLRYEPGILTTEQLQEAWQVHQSSVSRRMVTPLGPTRSRSSGGTERVEKVSLTTAIPVVSPTQASNEPPM